MYHVEIYTDFKSSDTEKSHLSRQNVKNYQIESLGQKA